MFVLTLDSAMYIIFIEAYTSVEGFVRCTCLKKAEEIIGCNSWFLRCGEFKYEQNRIVARKGTDFTDPFLLHFGGNMYSALELKELTIKPKINDITLDTLREFYEFYLNPFLYTYTIEESSIGRSIIVRFDRESFCHLLGIESIAKNNVQQSKLHNYRGENGWNNIKNGTIDIKHLKTLNKKKFQSVKAKYVYFYLIPSLLENPLAVNYDKSKVKPPTNIDCEILFYSQYDNAVIHLGLEKGSEDDFYFPRTFFVEKLGKQDSKDIYIENQEKITVIKENRVIIL